MRDNNRDKDRDGGKRGGARMKRAKKKFCAFCMDKANANATSIDYKDINKIRKFVTERGKILPRRISGNCALHQRQVTEAIKRARNVALLPFSSD